ncbi:MAG: Uncharacterized protein Athens071425_212 [Parcubacteria group bacterium Athens0714_25]|nr:MAG: Uncharacterized protein Athens071425_212 [Parcubacteria group bacterium Athens0714_25]
MIEDQNQEDDFMEEQSGVKSWIQENLRIIISVAIVIIIAGGIYSYAKRSPADDRLNILDENQLSLDGNVDEMNPEDGNIATEDEDVVIDEEKNNEEKAEPAAQEAEPAKQETAPSADSSKETNDSFIETAQKGDGLTHLARRALADYLEKNPDSQLTAEHKIYIEDYLRKNVSHEGKVLVGSSVEFSKDLINQAIEQSKKLNDNQLKNLQKYSAMVPSLS